MQEWEAIFLDTPRLFEPAEIIFRGQKCQTSHISHIELLEDDVQPKYRVKTISGGLYVGPVEDEASLSAPDTEKESEDKELCS